MFDKEKLKAGMGLEQYNRLEDVAIDKGAAFLDGQITSVMHKAMSSDLSVSLINTASLGTGIAVTGSKLLNSKESLGMLQELTTSIITVAMDTATSEIGKITGKIAAKATSLPLSIPGKIYDYTMSTFNERKKSFGEILKEVMTDQESLIDEDAEKQNAKAKNAALEKITKGLNKAKDFVEENMGKLNECLTKTATYIEEGPDMLSNEIDKVLTNQIKAVNKAVDGVISDIESSTDSMCKAQGEKIGGRMADTYNETLTKQAKMQLAKQKTLISKAKTMALKAKQAAILQVMSLTGVNVPL